MMKRTVQKIKQFQRQKYWVVLALVWVCLQSAWVYAEESDEFIASHGGQLFNFKSFYLELVARGGEVALYVTDHQSKAVSTENGQAAVIILNDNERSKTTIDLKPDQENSLRGAGDFLVEPNTTLTVFVKLFEKSAYVARLVPSGKVFNVEDILDISDFCNYYYINRDNHDHHRDFYYIYRIFCHLNDSQHNQGHQIQSPQVQSPQNHRVPSPQEKHRVKSSRESYDDGEEDYEEAESNRNRNRQKQSHEKNHEPTRDSTHGHHAHDDHDDIHEHEDGWYHPHDHHEDEGDHHEDEGEHYEEDDEYEEDEDEDEEDEDEEDEDEDEEEDEEDD